MQTIKKIINELLFADQTIIAVRPVYVQITGNYPTAAALSQIIHWSDWAIERKGRADGHFWKTDSDFREELGLTEKQFERVKRNLKQLPFIEISLKKQTPCITVYRINKELLFQEIQKYEVKKQNTTVIEPIYAPETPIVASIANIEPNPITELQATAQIPVTDPINTATPQTTQSPQKSEPSSPRLVVHNTKITNKDYSKTTTASEPQKESENVVVNSPVILEKIRNFDQTEQPAAIKLLSTLPETKIESVLTTFALMLATRVITNKIGYLRSLVTAVKQGTYTPAKPVTPAHQQLTAAEVIAKQEKRMKEEAERGKVTNEQWKAMMFKQYGIVVAI